MKIMSDAPLDYYTKKICTLIGGKVDKINGKGLSTNDYTSAEKSKLAGLNNYTHPTVSGYKHIPSGGNSGKSLIWASDGAATWGNVAWGNITDKPSTFAPSAHTHTWDSVTDKPSTFVPSAHTHGVIKSLNISGTTLSWTKDDGTTGSLTTQDTNTTYGTFKGATTSAAGSTGLVIAPAAGNANRYLRSDGTWAVPPDTNTTYGVVSSSTAGLMSVDDKKKLDGIAANANNYSHPTGAGYEHIPSGGSDGQVLRWSASGKAVWGEDKNTVYSAFKGATTSAAGGSGLVPAPGTSDASRFLCGDGTWKMPTDTTYNDVTQSVHGLMTAADKKKLDGIAEGANKYTLPTATSSVLGGVKIGSNITVSSGIISLTKDNVTNALGYTPPTNSGLTLEYGSNSLKIGNSNTIQLTTMQVGVGSSATQLYYYGTSNGLVLGSNNAINTYKKNSSSVASPIGSIWGGIVCGSYCNSTPDGDYPKKNIVFLIGNGTSSATSNAFRINTDGTASGSTYSSAGADYAEMFEWKDGNINTEDRRGLFVTLDGDKIRLANSDDDYILGIISGSPTVIGDAAENQWANMYERDIFGALKQDVNSENSLVLNPDYDAAKKYVPRIYRKEWNAVGLMGKLVVVDDGTCEVNGHCNAGHDGIGTKADKGYRVMERLDDTHIRVLVR